MKHREFVYVGEPIPTIYKTEHKEFLLSVHNAMLLALVEQNLLTKNQAERVLDRVIAQLNHK